MTKVLASYQVCRGSATHRCAPTAIASPTFTVAWCQNAGSTMTSPGCCTHHCTLCCRFRPLDEPSRASHCAAEKGKAAHSTDPPSDTGGCKIQNLEPTIDASHAAPCECRGSPAPDSDMLRILPSAGPIQLSIGPRSSSIAWSHSRLGSGLSQVPSAVSFGRSEAAWNTCLSESEPTRLLSDGANIDARVHPGGVVAVLVRRRGPVCAVPSEVRGSTRTSPCRRRNASLSIQARTP